MTPNLINFHRQQEVRTVRYGSSFFHLLELLRAICKRRLEIHIYEYQVDKIA